jgi:hypothetical protein
MQSIARTRILVALPALFFCTATLRAAQTPYVAAVIQAEADVRCKPSTDPKLYPTNRLPEGTRVLVLEERSDGWLGIQPPPGSFSWINSNQVERIVPAQANWVVKNDNVSVLVGGDVVNVRPSVEGVRLARGTQVRVMAKEVRDGDTVLFPIDPPAGEMRYIRAEAVKAEPGSLGQQPPATPIDRVGEQPKTVSAVPVSRTASKDPALNIPPQTTTAAPTLPANATPWQKAEYFERQGRWEDAIRIYQQLGKDLQATRPDWADFANKRAAYLRNGGKAPVNWSTTSSAVDTRASTFQPTVQSDPPQARLSPPTDPNASSAPTTEQTASWSSPQPNVKGVTRSGTLVRSGYYGTRDAQYRLSTQDDAKYMIYVTAGQGVDLEQYVDRGMVELGGTWTYRGDLKAYYMVVSNVRPL